jgi:hypothetical protein
MPTGENRIKRLAEAVLGDLMEQKLIPPESHIFSVDERERELVVDLIIQIPGTAKSIDFGGLSIGPNEPPEKEWEQSTKKLIRDRILDHVKAGAND